MYSAFCDVMSLVVYLLLLTVWTSTGTTQIERNKKFVQFPTDSNALVKISIDGQVTLIKEADTQVIATIMVNTTKVNSVEKCFCNAYGDNDIVASTTDLSHDNRYDSTCQLNYSINTHLLQALFSRTGIRCYIYQDKTLYTFRLMYATENAIRLIDKVQPEFKTIDIKNDAPHIFFLMILIGIIVILVLVTFPLCLWCCTRSPFPEYYSHK